MLSYFKKDVLLRVSFFAFIFLLISTSGFSQSLGDAIVNITFGSGTSRFAGPLAADSGFTTYDYYDNTTIPNPGFPQDGKYTITNTSAGMLSNLWVVTSDRTGNPNGYFMLVNAAYSTGVFYTRKVTALCPGTKYQFGAFIKNMFISGGIAPNVTFQIETEAGAPLTTPYNTGNIPTNGIWNPYSMEFTTPANTGIIVLKMINNAPGGNGNDLAIDDITFRPYGDPVQVVFDQSTATQICAGAPQTVTIKTTTTPATGYSQKIQQKINGAWSNLAPVNGNQYSFTSPLVAGTYNYRVVSGQTANIDNTQCVVASNELVLTILPQPTPAFTAPAEACLNKPVTFQDNSAPNGAAITAWLWDFGDGQTSTEQSPTHIYTATGDYPVKLTVKNGNNCISAPATKSIHINALPIADFTHTSTLCATKPIIFDATSSFIPLGTTVTSRVWDINGVIVNRADDEPFPHTFATAGTYTIKLTVTLSTGCTSEFTRQITVNPLPVVDFDTPPTCISDNTVFTNRTTIADNSALTYRWNFGDGTPIETAQNPLHKYQRADDYKITLTVTTANGCSEVLTKDFRVNGATPLADFTVINKNSLCSNREVVIENRSRMDLGVFGNVTRIEINYGDGSDATVDNNPTVGKRYLHTYPEIHSGTKTYTVRMLAYSGGVCVSQQKTEVINLLATPLVVFTQPPAICANNGPITLDGRDESNSGAGGLGTYSGTGVTPAGVFDPAVSGPGKFVIYYTYLFNTGCSNTISREITVNPVPSVQLPANITVLEGGNRVITATATGNGLTYAWLPVTGLNNPNIANPTVTGIRDITYRVTVTNDKDCQQFAEVVVTVLKTPGVPNAFTPNGDGINDTWEVKNLESYPGCTVSVFNRNGQKVFSSIGYPVPWDGRSNNGNLATGVYYYIIDPKNGRKTMSGYITIIK